MMIETRPYLNNVVVDGCEIVYYERGSGPALILLHGMFGDHRDWETVLEPLAHRFRVIAVDLPGFGESGKPERSYNAEFFVEMISGFLQAVGAHKPVLVGNSFGGEIAILYALSHPEDVEALVLVSSGGLRTYDDAERQRIREGFSVGNLCALTPAAHEWMFAKVFSEKGEGWRRYIDRQNARLARADYPKYAKAVARCIETAFSLDFDEQLRSIRQPVLLVWGAADEVFPIALAQTAMDRLPNAEMVLIPNAGHAPQLERPEAFVSSIEGFLERKK